MAVTHERLLVSSSSDEDAPLPRAIHPCAIVLPRHNNAVVVWRQGVDARLQSVATFLEVEVNERRFGELGVTDGWSSALGDGLQRGVALFFTASSTG